MLVDGQSGYYCCAHAQESCFGIACRPLTSTVSLPTMEREAISFLRFHIEK